MYDCIPHAQVGQKKMLKSLELEFQVVVHVGNQILVLSKNMLLTVKASPQPQGFLLFVCLFLFS